MERADVDELEEAATAASWVLRYTVGDALKAHGVLLRLPGGCKKAKRSGL